MDRQPERPASAASIWLTSASAFLLVSVFLGLAAAQLRPMVIMIGCILAIAAPLALVDLLWHKVHLRPSAGLTGDRQEPALIRMRRVGVKLVGLWITLSAVALAYWVFPIYRDDYYSPFFDLLSLIAPVFAVLAIPYFVFVDRRMSDPHDAYWLTGRLLFGGVPETREQLHELKHHFLGWTIKAFFLPLMSVFLFRNVQWITETGLEGAFSAKAVAWWLGLAFSVDVAYATVGYLFTLRLFDTHIRSANPFALGWLVALACYPPFWGLIEAQYLRYGGRETWEHWLADSPTLYSVWGITLVGLIAFYSWATVSFGLRFSNLTHRGIITNGPYALTKHPAYIAKNVFWWMTAMPFLTYNGWDTAVKGCLLLGLLNLIYVARAKTEEYHLSEDPVYVAYARWIAEYGAIARLRKASRRLTLRLAGVPS